MLLPEAQKQEGPGSVEKPGPLKEKQAEVLSVLLSYFYDCGMSG